MEQLEDKFFELLRVGLGTGGASTAVPALSPGDWDCLYRMAGEQSVLGIAYAGIERLPKDAQPPMELAFQWASEAETVRGHNRLVNGVAVRLTQLFAAEGRRSAILKGAANARLYPDAFIRQCGDVDIWVEGGRDSILDLLMRLNLLGSKDIDLPSYHHVHLLEPMDGVEVEVHFRPSSGNRSPFTNARLQKFLAAELANAELAPEGFYVPSMKFALAMQLSHIQRHFLDGGVGLRQVVDYGVLLRRASDAERAELAANLRRFGLAHTAGALMWVLGRVLGLERELMPCKPDAWRGRWMLREVLDAGNFGFYRGAEPGFPWRWFARRWKALRLFPFAPSEVLWGEVAYARWFFASIAVRIRLRKLSLKDVRLG